MYANETFEIAAAAFHKATGMLMPGKSIAAGAGWTEEQERERQKLFKVWCAAVEYMKRTEKKSIEIKITEARIWEEAIEGAGKARLVFLTHDDVKDGMLDDGHPTFKIRAQMRKEIVDDFKKRLAACGDGA